MLLNHGSLQWVSATRWRQGGWAANLAHRWAGARKDDELWLQWRFWYQSTSWLHFLSAVYVTPWKRHLGTFHLWITQTPVTSYFLGWVEEVAVVRLLPFFKSTMNIGVYCIEAVRPLPQDPLPSAPATTSTSLAAMREAHNLEDVASLTCVSILYVLLLRQPCMMFTVWKVHSRQLAVYIWVPPTVP